MPKLIHESTGLRIVQNEINDFCIVTLHYTADPRKRTPEWKKEAQAGMPPAQWAKEYEIDYTALFGEKVFPELAAARDKILVGAPYPEFPESQTYWGGLDFGMRNPSSFHVYTIHDGVIYSVYEVFEPIKSVPEFVGKMKEFPHWQNIRYIAADPSMWNKTQVGKAGPYAPVDHFFEAGLRNLMRGNHDENAWIATMREHWKDYENPTFRIYDVCANQIREFDTAVYASMSDRMAMTQNYRENIVDHNNHSLDDCKYFMNSRPRPREQQKSSKYPIMYKKWLH